MTTRIHGFWGPLGQVEGMRWSDVFTRTNRGPGVWHNRYDLRVRGIEVRTTSSYMSAAYSRQSFAGGGIESTGGYGFPSGAYSHVYGFFAMRFLCATYGVEPPKKRLKGEPFVPDVDLLVRLVLADIHGLRSEVPFETRLREAHAAAGIDVS